MNKLYYGDNLEVIRLHIPDESVDLIYLDPPFNSNADYNVLFSEQDGSRSAAQIKAFTDTWRWDETASAQYHQVVEMGGDVSRALQAFQTFIPGSNLLAYLSMMAPRLMELRRVLKPTGSIYLHCDPTASHYLKILLDAVFGANNFRNEIIWHYKRWSGASNHFQKMHDIIFWYSKTAQYIFTKPFQPYSDAKLIEDTIRGKVDGKLQRLKNPDGTYIKREKENKGVLMHDVWEDINFIAPTSKERVGYPTQKPLALLERIIKASSNEGDIVFDPFCGCGTAVVAAEKLKRKWIGIDITHLAVGLMKHRLHDAFDGKAVFETIGEPTSLPDAEALAAEDPYQFQWWSLGLVGARPNEQKKGADKGIDGRLYFHDEKDGKTKQVIFSVKAGKVGAAQVRDLRGVVEREEAAIGVFITMQKPSQAMRKEAASAGVYYSKAYQLNHPRIQILTVEELLSGKEIQMPPMRSETFKRSPRVKTDKADQRLLDLPED